MTIFAVVTTIQAPTPALEKLAVRLRELRARLVVVGDTKSPPEFDLRGADFLSLEDQLDLPWEMPQRLPTGHYARKNIGYLIAIAAGAEIVYETDDDNAPSDGWRPRSLTCDAVVTPPGSGWVNAYRAFSDEKIWPRGFPLDGLSRDPSALPHGPYGSVHAPIQQGLANGSPDVDAVWRLLFDRPFQFREGSSLFLSPGCWCPFNSQSTWWFPEAFVLLYLPSFCSFRMTDIWRSFVAQRCLWSLGAGVVFHPPEVRQERNEHDLIRDFEQEVPGYLGNRRMVDMLEDLDLENGSASLPSNLVRCYERLVEGGFFPREELGLVDAWIRDVHRVTAET